MQFLQSKVRTAMLSLIAVLLFSLSAYAMDDAPDHFRAVKIDHASTQLSWDSIDAKFISIWRSYRGDITKFEDESPIEIIEGPFPDILQTYVDENSNGAGHSDYGYRIASTDENGKELYSAYGYCVGLGNAINPEVEFVGDYLYDTSYIRLEWNDYSTSEDNWEIFYNSELVTTLGANSTNSMVHYFYPYAPGLANNFELRCKRLEESGVYSYSNKVPINYSATFPLPAVADANAVFESETNDIKIMWIEPDYDYDIYKVVLRNEFGESWDLFPTENDLETLAEINYMRRIYTLSGYPRNRDWSCKVFTMRNGGSSFPAELEVSNPSIEFNTSSWPTNFDISVPWPIAYESEDLSPLDNLTLELIPPGGGDPIFMADDLPTSSSSYFLQIPDADDLGIYEDTPGYSIKISCAYCWTYTPEFTIDVPEVTISALPAGSFDIGATVNLGYSVSHLFWNTDLTLSTYIVIPDGGNTVLLSSGVTPVSSGGTIDLQIPGIDDLNILENKSDCKFKLVLTTENGGTFIPVDSQEFEVTTPELVNQATLTTNDDYSTYSFTNIGADPSVTSVDIYRNRTGTFSFSDPIIATSTNLTFDFDDPDDPSPNIEHNYYYYIQPNIGDINCLPSRLFLQKKPEISDVVWHAPHGIDDEITNNVEVHFVTPALAGGTVTVEAERDIIGEGGGYTYMTYEPIDNSESSMIVEDTRYNNNFGGATVTSGGDNFKIRSTWASTSGSFTSETSLSELVNEQFPTISGSVASAAYEMLDREKIEFDFSLALANFNNNTTNSVAVKVYLKHASTSTYLATVTLPVGATSGNISRSESYSVPQNISEATIEFVWENPNSSSAVEKISYETQQFDVVQFIDAPTLERLSTRDWMVGETYSEDNGFRYKITVAQQPAYQLKLVLYKPSMNGNLVLREIIANPTVGDHEVSEIISEYEGNLYNVLYSSEYIAFRNEDFVVRLETHDPNDEWSPGTVLATSNIRLNYVKMVFGTSLPYPTSTSGYISLNYLQELEGSGAGLNLANSTNDFLGIEDVELWSRYDSNDTFELSTDFNTDNLSDCSGTATIPATTDSEFIVKYKYSHSDFNGATGESNVFTIQVNSSAPDFISLGNLGSESEWYEGDEKEIVWEASEDIESVNIIMVGEKSSETIASNIKNKGSYTWKVASELEGNFKIRVESSDDATIYDESTEDFKYIAEQDIGIVILPNPFNAITNFRFFLFQKQEVSLKIYNVLGREVASLHSGTMERGNNVIPFMAENLSGGMYFYVLSTKDIHKTGKIMYLK